MNLKCKAFSNLFKMFCYSPTILHKTKKIIITEMGHSNSSWHINMPWKIKSRNKTAYFPFCVKNTRGYSRSKAWEVFPFTRDVCAASQRTSEQGGAVHAHDSPQEGAHPKGVKGHPALKMHRKSKSLSKAVERIFIIRGCC